MLPRYQRSNFDYFLLALDDDFREALRARVRAVFFAEADLAAAERLADAAPPLVNSMIPAFCVQSK